MPVVSIVATLIGIFAVFTVDIQAGKQDQHHGRIRAPLNESEYILPRPNRDSGVVYSGSQHRLRLVLNAALLGKATKVGFIGGSCTEGGGTEDDKPWQAWPNRLMVMLSSTFPTANLSMFNGAKGGTTSTYMGLCLQEHLPADVDIVFVEYSVNDSPHPGLEFPARAGFEILLRRLLQLPHRPAVVVVNSFRWSNFMDAKATGLYWLSAEADYMEFCLYYHLPCLSLRSAAYHLARTGVPGFRVDNLLGMPREGFQEDALFIADGLHLYGPTGHRALAELAFHFLLQAALGLHSHTADAMHDHAHALADIPPPMLPDNWEPMTPTCFFGTHLQGVVMESQGFEYKNEARMRRAKWGYVASTAGARLRLRLQPLSVLHPSQVASGELPLMQLEFVYLRSWDGMGQAEVLCQNGCSCGPLQVEGHSGGDKISIVLPELIPLAMTPGASECELLVTVLGTTLSGGHKFKVVGFVLLNSKYDGAVPSFDHPGLAVIEGSEETGWRSQTQLAEGSRPLGVGFQRNPG